MDGYVADRHVRHRWSTRCISFLQVQWQSEAHQDSDQGWLLLHRWEQAVQNCRGETFLFYFRFYLPAAALCVITLTLACIYTIPREQRKGKPLLFLFILHLQCFSSLDLRCRNKLIKVLCGTMLAHRTCGLLCSRFVVMWLTRTWWNTTNNTLWRKVLAA